MLQTVRSQVRFPMKSLDISIDLNSSSRIMALGVDSASNINEGPGIFLRVKGGRRVRLTTSITWDITLRSCYLLHAGFLFDSLLTLKMEAIFSSETSLSRQPYVIPQKIKLIFPIFFSVVHLATLVISRLKSVGRSTNSWWSGGNPSQRHSCPPQIPHDVTCDRKQVTYLYSVYLSDAWFAN
jgi:hypothetical protein